MRIVIIEGNTGDRKTESRIIEQLGAEYELSGMASDPQSGYEMIRKVCPDLVIMDIHLAKFNSLSMLKKLKDEKNQAKILILTADTDPERMRQAIGLGIDDYLLKPIRAKELRKSIRRLGERMKCEQSVGKTFWLDSVIMSWLSGQIRPEDEVFHLAESRYGFSLSNPGAVFSIWFGADYISEKETAKEILKAAEKNRKLKVSILDIAVWKVLLVIFYQPDDNSDFQYCEQYIVPHLCSKLSGNVACLWNKLEYISELPSAVRSLKELTEWNLVYDRGSLISAADISKLDTSVLKYPVELADRLKKAVTLEDGEAIRRCYYALYDFFRGGNYTPSDIKECLIRFNLEAIDTYKICNTVDSELGVQWCMQLIYEAVFWSEIRTAMEKLVEILQFNVFRDEKDSKLSPLVRNAVELVRKYYDQGITLEETAYRLYVSEEYLSSQFKKETGTSFSETVRHYRIERIKYLLLNTRLKLNQIAELTGYTDPKYMSRVFKEETGMLPNEFRKAAR